MDRLGIEKGVISISTPGIPYGDWNEVKDMARRVSLLEATDRQPLPISRIPLP